MEWLPRQHLLSCHTVFQLSHPSYTRIAKWLRHMGSLDPNLKVWSKSLYKMKFEQRYLSWLKFDPQTRAGGTANLTGKVPTIVCRLSLCQTKMEYEFWFVPNSSISGPYAVIWRLELEGMLILWIWMVTELSCLR